MYVYIYIYVIRAIDSLLGKLLLNYIYIYIYTGCSLTHCTNFDSLYITWNDVKLFVFTSIFVYIPISFLIKYLHSL